MLDHATTQKKLEARLEPILTLLDRQIFVVDSRRRLCGGLPIEALLLHTPRRPVSEIMIAEVAVFAPSEDAADAARAFERYNLISAPVVDDRGGLVGRLPVDKVMDFVREKAEERALRREGLGPEEGLFGPVWRGARQRWLWLATNLLTAFLASRVIGLFEDSLERRARCYRQHRLLSPSKLSRSLVGDGFSATLGGNRGRSPTHSGIGAINKKSRDGPSLSGRGKTGGRRFFAAASRDVRIAAKAASVFAPARRRRAFPHSHG